MIFVYLNICHRMSSLWKLYSVTLTYFVKVKHLTLWLLNKFFCNCHLAPNKFFRFSFLASNNFFGFSLLAPNKIRTSTFLPTTDCMILFYEKNVLVLYCCISFLYRILFPTRWWKQHLDNTNSTPYKKSWIQILAEKILNKLLGKCIIQICMPNLYSFCYSFCYIQMYFRIY